VNAHGKIIFTGRTDKHILKRINILT